MEIIRRTVLIFCFFTAVVLAYYTPLEPLVFVRYMDFEKKLDDDRAAYRALKGMSSGKKGSTDDDRYRDTKISEIYDRLSKTSVEQYAAEKTSGKRIIYVKPDPWERFFDDVIAVTNGTKTDRQWTRRFPSDQHHLKQLFFKSDEPPANILVNYFSSDSSGLYLALKTGERVRYMEVDYRQYSDSDFSIFGFSQSPKPPSYLFYPYRLAGLILAAAGIVFYILLPWPRKKESGIRYPTWIIVLGDTAAAFVSLLFFVMPFAIVGGFKQAFLEAWPLMIPFWLICAIYLYLFKITAWYSAFGIVVLNDRLRLSTYTGIREYLYNDMEYFEPVIFKPPRWLIVFLWIAVLANKGGTRLMGMGQALILQGSEYGSIGIGLRNGKTLYINLTNQIGGVILKDAASVLAALRRSGVEERTEAKVARSLGLETVR